jgi:hypothetical protein
MAFSTGEVMVVAVPAGPVGVASIRKFDPVQQPHVGQHFNGPEDGGAAQARIDLLQVVPERLDAEILAALSQFRKPIGNPIPGLGFAPPLFFEGRPDFFGYHRRITLSIHG